MPHAKRLSLFPGVSEAIQKSKKGDLHNCFTATIYYKPEKKSSLFSKYFFFYVNFITVEKLIVVYIFLFINQFILNIVLPNNFFLPNYFFFYVNFLRRAFLLRAFEGLILPFCCGTSMFPAIHPAMVKEETLKTASRDSFPFDSRKPAPNRKTSKSTDCAMADNRLRLCRVAVFPATAAALRKLISALP